MYNREWVFACDDMPTPPHWLQGVIPGWLLTPAASWLLLELYKYYYDFMFFFYNYDIYALYVYA